MRKIITGQVGDPAFAEGLRALRDGSRRITFFACRGDTEKFIHFAGSYVLTHVEPSAKAAAPPTSPLAQLLKASVASGQHSGAPSSAEWTGTELGTDALEPPDGDSRHKGAGADPAYVDAACRFVLGELLEVCSWKGALFEVCEGSCPQSILADTRLLRISCPCSKILARLDPGQATDSARLQAPPWVLPVDPMARLQALGARGTAGYSQHLVSRALASLWKLQGAPVRAARSLVRVARHYEEWGLDDQAVRYLEEALDLYPLDAAAAEELMALYRASGRPKDAEKVAEGLFGQLEKLKRYEAILALYRTFQHPPESVTLRRLGAEGMIRNGEMVAGIRELATVARSLETERDPRGAEKIYERMLEADASSEEASQGLLRLRRGRAFRRRLRTWGTVLGGLILAVCWVLWDAASAAAIYRVKAQLKDKDPREVVGVLRAESSSYPLTRHAARLASMEKEIHEARYQEDRRFLVQAIEAHAEGELKKAYVLFDDVRARTLVPAFAARAETGRLEVAAEQASLEGLMAKADQLVRRRELEQAFAVCCQVFRTPAGRKLARGLRVPVMLETMPPGASIRIGDEPAGETPRWIFLSLDQQLKLRLELQGFRPREIMDPLAGLLDKDDPRLRVTLAVEAAWEVADGGGSIPSFSGVPESVIPVFGADGVLRGLDAEGPRLLWATPFDWRAPGTCPAVAEGPAVIAPMAGGKLIAFSLSKGAIAWTASVLPSAGEPHLGPISGGQLLVIVDGRARLVNVLTGLPVRDLDLGGEAAAPIATVVGGMGVFALQGGGIAAANLETGRLEFVRKGRGGLTLALVERDGQLIVLGAAGLLTALLPGAELPLWESELGRDSIDACAAGADSVCVAASSGKLTCLRAKTGDVLWEAQLQGRLVGLQRAADPAVPMLFATVIRGDRQHVVGLWSADGGTTWEVETGAADGFVSVATWGSSILLSSAARGTLLLNARRS